jgi:hypothetical protein
MTEYIYCEIELLIFLLGNKVTKLQLDKLFWLGYLLLEDGVIRARKLANAGLKPQMYLITREVNLHISGE